MKKQIETKLGIIVLAAMGIIAGYYMISYSFSFSNINIARPCPLTPLKVAGITLEIN